jgi:alpha-beta hydrolase superfamily lysophospholipase
MPPRKWPSVRTIISKKILTSVLATFALTLSACTSVFYQPTNEKYYDPKQVGVDPQDIWFKSANGTKLHGWYLEAPKSKGLIVFFHGNGENLTSHYVSLSWIVPQGYSYFIFDYQGYGESEGNPSQEKTIQDGHAAVKWAYENHRDQPLIIFGQSLGGTIALRTAIDMREEVPIRLVAVESTFHSYQAMSREVLSRSALTWLLQPLSWVLVSDKYAPDDEIAKLSPIPLIVIHGDKDKVVEYEMGQKVFARAGDPKEFWTVTNGRHIGAFWQKDQIFRERFLKRLNEVVAKPAPVSITSLKSN